MLFYIMFVKKHRALLRNDFERDLDNVFDIAYADVFERRIVLMN